MGLFVIFSLVYSVGRGLSVFFFFQAEDGIRDLVRSRGLGDVYKRQVQQLRSLINIPDLGCILIQPLMY